MIDETLWAEFVAWWKEHWPDSSPDRTSVTLYLEWRETKIKDIDWGWRFNEP
jgi:hypothetical protein